MVWMSKTRILVSITVLCTQGCVLCREVCTTDALHTHVRTMIHIEYKVLEPRMCCAKIVYALERDSVDALAELWV